MASKRAYVGTTPTLTDVIVDENGNTVDLTGATVTLVYRPSDLSSPQASVAATPDADQVANEGGVFAVLGSPIMDAPGDWEMWWHVEFNDLAGTVLDTDNFEIQIVTHGPGTTPYLTASLFRRLTRVKQSRLGIAQNNTNQPYADEFLQTEIDRAAVYVEFVTGQPATDSEAAVLDTMAGTVSPGATQTLIGQAIQMRTEQVLFQSQNSYLDDASDDVVSSFSVGGYSQSKNDSARRGEEKQLNSWQSFANVLWLLMTPDRYYFWEMFLSSDPTAGIPGTYSFENTIQPEWVDGWGYAYGGADFLIGGMYGTGIGTGGWQGGYGGLPGGLAPLPVDVEEGY